MLTMNCGFWSVTGTRVPCCKPSEAAISGIGDAILLVENKIVKFLFVDVVECGGARVYRVNYYGYMDISRRTLERKLWE